MSSSSGVNLEKYLIPLDEIKRATENFSCKIGGGGFGSVYKGTLSERWENRTVAVKRLDADSRQGWREFRNEIELISKFQHENIIAFIGYCDEEGEMIIVYEYASNGSLDDHLRDPNKMNRITWAQRLEICIGAARGLHYLHSGLGDQDRVIHRDVKSANILLDGNMVAKICDFGLSKVGPSHEQHTRLNTKVAGTEFYLDPAYRESGNLQKESDIYSLGVVLFEVVSGMLVYHERSIGDERQSLMSAVRRYHPMELHKLIDPYVRDQIKFRSFYRFDEIAYQCLNFNLAERPTLDTIVEKLEEASTIQISELPPSYALPSRSMIESLIGMLNSVGPYDLQMTSGEIRLFKEYFRGPGESADKDWAIPGLAQLLITSPDSETQEQAMAALSDFTRHKGNDIYGGIIVSSGAVPGIVRMLEKGSHVARENAAHTIGAIYYAFGAQESFTSAGAIPPLVLLLSEGTAEGKQNAAFALLCLCNDDYENKGRAVRAGLVPILMELFMEPQGVSRGMLVTFLKRLFEHPGGRLAIGEAEAVPRLLELLGNVSLSYEDAYVLSLLKILCSMDEKYLLEAQEHGVMGILKYLLKHGSHPGKIKARELRRMIKDHQHVDYGSDGSDVEDVGVTDDESVMSEPDPPDSWLVAFAKRISLICDQFTTHSCIR